MNKTSSGSQWMLTMNLSQNVTYKIRYLNKKNKLKYLQNIRNTSHKTINILADEVGKFNVYKSY